MERIMSHNCSGTADDENEVCVLDSNGRFPNEWVLATDYNVQLMINFCPFCGVNLKEMQK